MKHIIRKTMYVVLTLALLLGLLTVSASAAELPRTISSVAITVDRPVEGEPLLSCVPTTNLCNITCIWSTRGLNGETVIPATTLAEAGTTYNLMMILTPKSDLYTFADSVTGTVNGNTVTVTRASGTRVSCLAHLTPKTKADTVDVSVPQPVYNATAGTPTVTNGRAVETYTWYKTDTVTTYQMQNSDVFDGYHTYHFKATVSASANEVFTENTTITVNGKATGVTDISRDLDANTINFRYDVTEILDVAPYVGVADGSDGYWSLINGDTKSNGNGYTASYLNGTLTLTNTGNSAISGFYNYNDAYYCGIYADGNLNIRLEGDFCFALEGVPETAAHVYGIYVSGDLNLVNSDAAVDRTVSFLPAEGVLATTMSSGIHCSAGSLSIQNESQKGFTLHVRGAGVRPVDGSVVETAFTNNGIYTDGTLTIGDNCTVNATAADVQLAAYGTTTSRGIYAYSGLTIGENAVVTATGGKINPSQSATTLNVGSIQYCYGVQAEGGNITVSGGTLTAKGGDIDYGDLTGTCIAALSQESYGIHAGNITLNGGKITAKAGISNPSDYTTSSLSEGISCSNLTVSGGTLEATADDAWWERTGLWVLNSLTQTDGTITGTGDLAVCAGSTNGTGSRGIFVAGTLSASGGSLTGTGGTMGGNSFPSVGLQANTIELSGTAQVTGIGGLTTTGGVETTLTGSSTFGSYPGDSIGVRIYKNLTVDGNAVLTATGGTVKGDRSSAAEAMSIGLDFRLADGFTISGSGTVVATGGETHFGSKGNNLCDRSCGIYGDAPSLTISGTTVTATGGSVSTKTVNGSGVTMGGVSYGLHLPAGSLTLQNGAKLTATGGENPNYSKLSMQLSKHNDSYGAYIKGDITVTDSVFIATGGLSMRTVGLLHGGTVTLSGMSSRLTASADTYHSAAAGTDKYSYGAMNGSVFENWDGGNYTVNGGILILQGQKAAINYTTKTLTAPVIQISNNWDGSDPVTTSSPASLSMFNQTGRRYVKADGTTVAVTIKDWTYGSGASTLTYTKYGGEPTILYTGTTRAGASYSSDTAPTEAGSYTVTVTYPGGQTGSADFTVAPLAFSDCSMSLNDPLTYNGAEQTMGVTVTYNGKELAEGTDYTLSGNTGTNAGTYTITATGRGNYEGTKTTGGTIQTKKPTIEDFDLPTMRAWEYASDDPVAPPVPKLKDIYTGGGEITLSYSTGTEPPTEVGKYNVYFEMTAGENFSASGDLLYGTLVVRPAGFGVIVDIEDWTYGSAASTPTFTEYDGTPSIRYTGTTWAGVSYDLDTPPTEAGDYTVTVTYAPGGQTGSDDFKVLPKNVTFSIDLASADFTYDGTPHTQDLTVRQGGTLLVKDVDYTVSGNTQTDAGTYTITVTGHGNYAGTGTRIFSISQKTPTVADFNIPAIAEYAYTGNPVELPLPTLKDIYTGGGTVTLYYAGSATQPTAVGEHTVYFTMTEGENFHSASNLEYGKLVIKPAGFAVIVDIEDWTYGEEPSRLTYTDYDGDPTILYTGTTRAGASYSSGTAPTDAGSYTVTVTYPSGRTGSADFTVAPRSLSECIIGFDGTAFTYNGAEQTKDVTIGYNGTELVKDVDYTITGNTQTNAGSYTITITGKDNFEGTATRDFTIGKEIPDFADFNIPEIGEYAYTGNPVELPPPTLREPYTGGGTIILYYGSTETPPTLVGSYDVSFQMTEGQNFYGSDRFEYGKLVIKPEGFSVIVNIEDWTYGEEPSTPTYTDYDGTPTIRWTGTTRAGEEYSSAEAPTDAGSYTVTVTYAPGGQTGSADFTVHPESVIPYCSVTLDTTTLTYNGLEQTKGVTVDRDGTVLVEGVDYTVTGNTQTNAGSYTITITGLGNVGGTKTRSFSIGQKTPTVEDFNIPAITEYAYTGNPVELSLPTLKAPYTGCGEITLHYNSIDETQPTEIGEHTVYFKIAGGDNFSSTSWLEYGKLVIRPAGFAVIVDIADWTYGEEPSTLTYTDYDGDPTILYTGTTRAGASYSSGTVPTDAGSYTVTVTYPSGRTGSANFTVAPQSISACPVNLDATTLTYNGLEQTKGVTVSYNGITQVEGVDYTVTGNKQTNAGTYTITVTGTGNIEGTRTRTFYINKKTPTAADFTFPAIGEYTYTGNPVELPLPTLKEPYTGGGKITMYYGIGVITPPTNVGTYTMSFDMSEGQNFTRFDTYGFGTLVIGPPAPVSNIGILDLEAPQAGKTPDTAAASEHPGLYNVTDVLWLDEDGVAVGSFEEGKFYTAEITVSANYTDGSHINRFNFADSVTATLNGNPVTGEGCSVTKNADGTVTILYKFPATEAPSTAIRGTVTVTGTSAAASVTVEDFSGTNATLIVVQYSGSGQMMALRMISVTTDNTFTTENPFTHEAGCAYRAFLVNSTSFAPLCGAADLE